eukprot:310259_1
MDAVIVDVCAAANGDATLIDCTRVIDDINEQCKVCKSNNDACDITVTVSEGCIIDSEWGDWTECSAPCDGGQQSRKRSARDAISNEICAPESETRSCNEQSCSICIKDDNYVYDGVMCVAWGDPHFTTFNGNKHDFQGNKNDLRKTQFNYMYPCIDYTFEEQPFALIGTHYPYFGRAQTG